MNALLKDLTPAEIQFLKECEQATTKKTAELLDVSSSQVSKALGTKRKYTKLPPKEKLKEALDAGYSPKEIAELYGASYSAMSKALRKIREEGEDIVASNPAFKRVSMTVFQGKTTEFRIMDNGNVSFRWPGSKERVTLYGDELSKFTNDLLTISQYMTKRKG